MIKTCKQIDEEIKEVRRKLQQSRLARIFFKNKYSEGLDNENAVESTEENRNSSRFETGTN